MALADTLQLSNLGRSQTYLPPPSTHHLSQFLTDTQTNRQDQVRHANPFIAQESHQINEERQEQEQEEKLDETILSLAKQIQEQLKYNEQSLKDDIAKLSKFRTDTEEMFVTQERRVDDMLKTQEGWRHEMLSRIKGIKIDDNGTIPMRAEHSKNEDDSTDLQDISDFALNRNSKLNSSVNDELLKKEMMAKTSSVWEDLAQLDPNYNPGPQGQAHSRPSDSRTRRITHHNEVTTNRLAFLLAPQGSTFTTLGNTFRLVDFDPLQSYPSDNSQLSGSLQNLDLDGLYPRPPSVGSSTSFADETMLVVIDDQHHYNNITNKPVNNTPTNLFVDQFDLTTSGINADLPSDDDDDFLPGVCDFAPVESLSRDPTAQHGVQRATAYDSSNEVDSSQIATLIQNALNNASDEAGTRQISDNNGPLVSDTQNPIAEADDGISQDSLTSRTVGEMDIGQRGENCDSAPTSETLKQNTTAKAPVPCHDLGRPIPSSHSELSLLLPGRHRAFTYVPAKRARQSSIPARARSQTQSKQSQRGGSQSARQRVRTQRRVDAEDGDYGSRGSGKTASKRKKTGGGITKLAGRGGELRMSDGVRRVEGVTWPQKGENTLVGLLRSIECERCHGNVHWACAGLEEDADPGDVEWVCPDCMALILQGKALSQTAQVPTDQCVRPDCIRRAKQKIIMKEGDERQYIVESVIGLREAGIDTSTGRKKIECLVKWYGWPIEQSTWEPKSSLQQPENAMLEFETACNKSGVDSRKKPALLPCAREFGMKVASSEIITMGKVCRWTRREGRNK